MLIYTTATLCALLLIGCLGLARALRRALTGHDADRTEWERRIREATGERDHAAKALWTFMEAAQTSLFAMADEVERATGHSDEAYALSSLAHDVMHARNPFEVVTKETIDKFVRAGVATRAHPLHLGQALEIATALDNKARRSERGLYKMTRLCLIDRSPSEEARWLAETLGLMQRLCGLDAAEARRKLRAVLDVWERTDLFALESAINSGRCN
jgi:hypothetical protein